MAKEKMVKGEAEIGRKVSMSLTVYFNKSVQKEKRILQKLG